MWILAVILAVWAGWMDWRSRRIPNWLTVSGILVGLATNSVLGGWPSAKAALAGAGLALLLLLPAVLLRGLGGGDWKLMAALGAMLGWQQFLRVMLLSIFIAGILALGQMVRHKRVGTTLANLWELVRGFFVFGLKPHPVFSLDNPSSATLPFGVAAAFATLLCYGAAAIHH